MKIALIMIFCLTSQFAAAVSIEQVYAHKAAIWSLPDDQHVKRWVVIHNLKSAAQDKVFHLEIIARNKGDKVWQVQRLVKHMAVSPQALLADIQRPLNKGAVYPEPFNNAFVLWKKQSLTAEPQTMVCQSSILACM